MPMQIAYPLYVAVEFIKMYIVSHKIFGQKLKTRLYGICGVVTALVYGILASYMDLSIIPLGAGEAAGIAMMIALIHHRDFIYIILYWIVITTTDGYITSLIMYIFPGADIFFATNTGIFVRNGISLFLYLAIYFYLDKNNLLPIYMKGKKIIIFIIFPALVLFFYVGIVHMSQLYPEKFSAAKYSTIFFDIIVINILIIAFTICIILWSRQLPKRIYEKELAEYLANEQVRYYEALLQKDDDIRAFRHDIRSHILSMQVLNREKRYEELSEYIDKLTEELSELSHIPGETNDHYDN